jgi:gas vesicle protein
MSKFTKGLLFGALAGGIGGLLFAPKSGKATRQQFLDEVEEWTDLKGDFSAKLDRFKESAEILRETADLYVEPFIEGINQDIQNFNFQAEPRMNQIQEQIEKIQSELPDVPESK